MRAAVSLLLPLLWSSVCQHAAGSELNVTEQEQGMPILRTSNISATEVISSGVDYEEEDAKEVMAPQFLVGDSGTGELQLKKPGKPEGEKKNPNKQKRKGNKKKKNRKKTITPCEGEFKSFCVHGECLYIENIQAVTCRCLPNYFGERCVEQFLKTQRNDDATSNSFPVIAAIVGTVVGLTLLSFVIIVIVIIVQVRKKCPKYDEKEERKKLRHENGSSSNGV